MSETVSVTWQFLCGQLVRWLPDETDVWMIVQRHYIDGQGERRIRYGLVRYDPEQPLASMTAYESDIRLDARNPVAWPTLQQEEGRR